MGMEGHGGSKKGNGRQGYLQGTVCMSVCMKQVYIYMILSKIHLKYALKKDLAINVALEQLTVQQRKRLVWRKHVVHTK